MRNSDAVVLDTSVLVAALRSNTGASAARLRLALAGRVEIAASIAIFLEYEEVLQRVEQRRVHQRSPDQVDLFLRILARTIIPVDIHFRWRPQLRDADDEMVLDAAIAGEVKAIVTHNVKDSWPAASRFGIQILTPSAFLQELNI